MRRPPLLVLILFAAATLLFWYSLTSLSSGPTRAPPSHDNSVHAAAVVAQHATSINAAEYWLPPKTQNTFQPKYITGCASERGPQDQRQPALIKPLPCAATAAAACAIAATAPDYSLLLLATFTNAGPLGRDVITSRLSAARAAVAPGQLLVIAHDADAASIAQQLQIAWWRPPSSAGSSAVGMATAWRAASELLRAGCTIVISAAHVQWHASPFAHLAKDVDVEAAQLGESRGSVVGVHDPPMGWSAYGQTMTVPLLDAAIVAMQPTVASAELAAQLATAADAVGSTDVRTSSPATDFIHDHDLSMLLTRLVHAPAHDGQSRAGVSMRALRSRCFGAAPGSWTSAIIGQVASRMGDAAGASASLALRPSAASLALAAAADRERALGPTANDILTSRAFAQARAHVLSHGCTARPIDAGGAKPRPPNWVLDPTEPFPRAAACGADENMRALCELLRVAAIHREVLAAVSNKNIHAMLGTFLAGCSKANITNAVVVALDDQTAAFARSKGAHTYVRKLVSRTGSTDNHATSGLKFAVIYEFLSAGCSVLLSDVDVLWLANPFSLPSLYRDVDVEGMTDGWDDRTAYGYHWRGQKALRLSARNSGLFYTRATLEAVAMMGRLRHRMQHESVWDQTAYNEEMWWATQPGQRAHGVSARVMNYFCNMNSKVLFRFMLDDADLMTKHRPVSIHINYHPEKLPRMEDVFEHYYGLGPDLGAGVGKPTKRSASGGLNAWHWGVGLKAGKACREATRLPGGDGSPLAERILKAGGNAKWAGISGLGFMARGMLKTPWGAGTWGHIAGARSGGASEDVLFADFIGQQHLVRLHSDGWPKLASTRCADFENVTVTIV